MSIDVGAVALLLGVLAECASVPIKYRELAQRVRDGETITPEEIVEAQLSVEIQRKRWDEASVNDKEN